MNTRSPRLQEALDQVLANLERDCHSPQDVASKLQALGIKGRPVQPGACPLARYVQAGLDANLLGSRVVSVGTDDVKIYDPVGILTAASAVLSPILRQFRHEFDTTENYPALAEPRRSATSSEE
jgi:hypothetical protein